MVDPFRYLPWQLSNAREIYSFFLAKTSPAGVKLEPWHAAAFVEQADAESSFEPSVRGDHGEAFGLFQMHDDRIDAIKRATGIDIVATPTVEKQLEGVWWELTHPELIHLNQILKAGNAYDAGYLTCKLWERAGAPGQPAKRGQGAQAWLAWLTAHPARAA
jgi:hypothetical protein